jgi:hypothetical protein
MKTPVTATVIFDNGGGVTIQLKQGDATFAAYYGESAGSIGAAHGDVWSAMWDNYGFDNYDNTDEDAASLVPTQEQIRNGGYRVVTFASFAELKEFCEQDHDEDWANVRDFANA